MKHIFLTLILTLMFCLLSPDSFADNGELKKVEDTIVSKLFYTACPACNGNGWIDYQVVPYIGEFGKAADYCWRCKGRGRLISWVKISVCGIIVIFLILTMVSGDKSRARSAEKT